MEETKAKIYPMREIFINLILDEVRNKMSGANSTRNANRLMDALHSIKELIPPDRFETNPDVVHHKTVSHFSFWDRIKILIGKPVTISSLIYTREKCNVMNSSAETFIPKLFNRKYKIKNAEMQISETK